MASSMAGSGEEMVPIKTEKSEYPTSFYSPESPDLKRRRSEHYQDLGEKRQRLDYDGPYSNGSTRSLSIAELAEQAAKAVEEQYYGTDSNVSTKTKTLTIAELADQAAKAVVEQYKAPDPNVFTQTKIPSIAELAEQASKAVMKQYETAAQNQNQIQNQTQIYHQSSPPNSTSYAAPRPIGNERGVPAGEDFISDPYLYMRVYSLPILESLSTQILATLAQGPYSETIRIVQDPDSELGQAYATLKSLFDQTKRIYSKDGFFLSADELNIKEPEHRATIRTTNLASFSAAVFSSSVGFYELSSSFIDIVTPDGACLEKEPGDLLVNLKTQMYLSMVTSEEQTDTKEDVLEEMFPYDYEEVLQKRHPDIPLSQHELEFISLINGRREYLMNEPTDVDAIQVLSEKFGWEGFLTGVSCYLRKKYEPLLAPFMKRHALTAPASPRRASAVELHQKATNSIENANDGSNIADQDISMHVQLAADEVRRALGYSVGPSQNTTNPQQTQPLMHNGFLPPDAVPYPTQSAPTQVLYEKARRAASTKASSASARRPGTPSQRRPWTNEEENTLMAGLDQVKGPHWSQILALYGPNGSLNDILRDRNQVQLKDKARNLKLFFLKSGIEVPYYLQCVTGELKTRAPTQAAKREAEQRALLASEDELMRQEGISALNGMAIHAHGHIPSNSGDFSASMSEGPTDDGMEDGMEEHLVVEEENREVVPGGFPEMREAGALQDLFGRVKEAAAQEQAKEAVQQQQQQQQQQQPQPRAIAQEQTREAVQQQVHQNPPPPPGPPILSDEDHLRQTLLAVNAGNTNLG